jgi:hypothetical protein
MKDNRQGRPGWLLFPLALLWLFIAGVNIFALFWELVVSFSLFTTGGWANDWPLDISYEIALSTGCALYVALMLWTAATVAGSVLGCCCALFRLSWRRQASICIWCFSIAAVVVFCLRFLMFVYVYALAA